MEKGTVKTERQTARKSLHAKALNIRAPEGQKRACKFSMSLG
jgi:hypothetical protein